MGVARMKDRDRNESVDQAKRKTLKKVMLQVPIIVTFKVSELQAQASQPVSTWSGGKPVAPK